MQNALVRRFLVTLVAHENGIYSVLGTHDTGHAWMDLDWSAPIEVQVRVVDGAIDELESGGQRVALSPEAERTNYSDFANGECGFFGKGNDVTYIRALRHNLRKEQ